MIFKTKNRKRNRLLCIAIAPALLLSSCELIETTPDPPDDDNDQATVTDIDGNVYQTVIIGNQVWMAENLRTTRCADGQGIPGGLTDEQWDNTSDPAQAVYDPSLVEGIQNEEAMVEAYGKLYNWYAVDDLNLCPDGWRMPDDDDWDQLLSYLELEHGILNTGLDAEAGNVLKSCRQVNSPLGGHCDTSEHPRFDEDSNRYGTDEFGFGTLPGGKRFAGPLQDGEFDLLGELGVWWSATSELGHSYATTYSVRSNRNYFSKGVGPYPAGQSVRCIRATHH